MSNTDFTPDFYKNPLIGLLPADTADNFLYSFALLKKLDYTNWDHDESMGLFRILEAMQGAAHHLRLAMEPDEGEKPLKLKPGTELPEFVKEWIREKTSEGEKVTHEISVGLFPDESAELDKVAQLWKCSREDALSRICISELALRMEKCT